MKLAIGVVRDSSAVDSLAQTLIREGGVADQLLVMTDKKTELSDNSSYKAPSMRRVCCKPSIKLWSVREPHYFSGGIRDQRLTVRNALNKIAVIQDASCVAQQSSRLQAVSRHMPLVILQLDANPQQARSQLSILMKLAQTQVEIVESLQGELMGSFHFNQGAQD